MSLLAPERDQVGVDRVRMMRTQLSGPAATGLVPAHAPKLDPLARSQRRVDLLETTLREVRARENRFEAALAEIVKITRGLTGQTTSRVYELAAAALGIETPPPVSEEPFE